MSTYKPMCPQCHSVHTIIRTSRRTTPTFQTLYCDCLNEHCMTRFVVESATTHIIHSMFEDKPLPVKASKQENQLTLNI
ncbi:hypothetical protein GLP30_10940 [Photobacterium phosphoreum]|uniref:Zinc finger Ogr/Delta-type domain-containing protein n=1 Tax=Photobacterium phosphoreum TaxID=659 RepID=A0AAW4ZVU8_PHOPO|nr:ogr/Delta-like zinc finger family protein [Photobacterium phosphoreum]MCD9474050.1 hypothetical protein [Photobacterium phosphoreum]MCD9491336.1 hypothetical protein [Photobacterium phosphoreum]MCD9502375.1 hypothetical protein [Photobacterium phosphoreum]MCD9518182.1 hypothetical protein [Photobacterium phosphoreum]MCF2174474.1 hypothetical protein [Photobacterium phosphoreum]